MSAPRDPILDELPPERLLDADHLQPIIAGINCMHSIETVQQYLAYENTLICSGEYFHMTGVHSFIQHGQQRECQRGLSA